MRCKWNKFKAKWPFYWSWRLSFPSTKSETNFLSVIRL